MLAESLDWSPSQRRKRRVREELPEVLMGGVVVYLTDRLFA